MTRPLRSLRARRAPAAAVALVAAASVLAACSGDTDPGAADDHGGGEVADCQEAEPTGSFEFHDARGKDVELDTVPTEVVAQGSVAASLLDAGYQVDGVYGELNESAAGGLSYQNGDLDLGDYAVYGKTWGEFDVDQLGKDQPDLLVDYSFDGKGLWYLTGKPAQQVERLVPTIGMSGDPKSIDEAIGEFTDLATRLGLDTDCNTALARQRKDYRAAVADLTAVTEKKDLKVLIVSAGTGTAYVANPEMLPEARSMMDAGVDLMAPKSGKPQIFHELSFEKIPDYADADVILLDARAHYLGAMAVFLAIVAVMLAAAALVLAVAAWRRTRVDLDDVPEDLPGLRREFAALRGETAEALRHLAVVRYDAFSDLGGRLSWSLALLDRAGDGVVLTSIRGRNEARTYAKSITDWRSDQELSPEEQEAVEHAKG